MPLLLVLDYICVAKGFNFAMVIRWILVSTFTRAAVTNDINTKVFIFKKILESKFLDIINYNFANYEIINDKKTRIVNCLLTVIMF